MSFLVIVMGLLLIGVLVVLVMGIFNLARGGEGSAERSNKLMNWRVWLQGGVIGVLVLMFMSSGE